MTIDINWIKALEQSKSLRSDVMQGVTEEWAKTQLDKDYAIKWHFLGDEALTASSQVAKVFKIETNQLNQTYKQYTKEFILDGVDLFDKQEMKVMEIKKMPGYIKNLRLWTPRSIIRVAMILYLNEDATKIKNKVIASLL